jgi:hypothetical protein
MRAFTWILNAVVHITIIASILAFIGSAITLAFTYGKPSAFETFLRFLAIVAGFLIYAGSRAVGLSMPELILSSINQSGLGGDVFKTFIIPAGAGIASTWLIIHGLKDSKAIAVRVSLMLATFVLVLLVDSYFSTYSFENPGGLNKFLVPNLVFALASVLYAVLFLKPEDLQA